MIDDNEVERKISRHYWLVIYLIMPYINKRFIRKEVRHMDPATHVLTGIAVSKLGEQAMSIQNPAFIGIVLGAIAPDFDIVLQKWGDYVYLKNHRGISHSIIGIIGFAGIITLLLSLFYPEMNGLHVFGWTICGCLSHIFMDLLNSYGVQLLWPFYNKKIGFGLFVITDPFVIVMLGLYVVINLERSIFVLMGILLYIVIRIIMLYSIQYRVKAHFNVSRRSVNVLPAMISLFNWHFVVRHSQGLIIGEKNIFNNKIKIIEELKGIEKKLIDYIVNTKVGKFFTEFTPLYHITWDEAQKTFRFIDVRYYIRNTFLHHATAKVSDTFEVIEQQFHPYSMTKNVKI